MADDLPPYLTHVRGRNVPWKGHEAFPRNVVRLSSGGHFPWHGDLRVFKRRGVVNVEYYELTAEQIEKYLEDPTHA